MSTAKEFQLESNRAQVVSETDSFTPDRYRQMFGHFPRDAAKVLDAGCNTGRGGAVLKALDSGLQIVGLDCVQERVTSLDPSIYSQGICSFSTQLPLPNDSFDAIAAGEFIEHVPPVEVEATLAEFFRVLRLRGRLILTTPNPNYLKNKVRHLSVLLEKSHLTQHYPDCLPFRLRMVGFSSVKVYGSGRMTRYIGQRFPWLAVYGSYLVRAEKW
ncbi:MAG TPA: class I SAM-dependent methyltransferase [Candidatus Acidoferrum sp.]|jgi:ubiquinone/menaquinone biosynthesis C-methylase UbiE|nr:class I SAM-dependent methyltransferase [Candidatus Acidoferrum sp.]